LPIIPVQSLWEIPFIESEGDHRVSIANFTQDVFEAAVRGLPERPEMRLRTASMNLLVAELQEAITAAIHSGDFSKVLSPRRSFTV
jgi:hypothetical protein